MIKIKRLMFIKLLYDDEIKERQIVAIAAFLYIHREQGIGYTENFKVY